MKVDIAALRVKLNSDQREVGYYLYELNEALNELEEKRQWEYDNEKAHADLARVTQIKDGLIVENRRLKAEVAELKSPKTEFAAWLERVHPGMIESVTLTFNTKEN